MKWIKWLRSAAALLLALVLLTGAVPEITRADAAGAAEATVQLMAKSKKNKKNKSTPTPAPQATAASSAAAAAPTPTPEPDGPIIEPQAIADYLFAHGELPDNFITKKEAQALGWDSRYNYVSDVAPGKSIGGDYFGNYEGQLPKEKGRRYYEADCYYTKGKRNAYRVIFSNDGLVFYTDDHYTTFTQLFPSWEQQ